MALLHYNDVIELHFYNKTRTKISLKIFSDLPKKVHEGLIKDKRISAKQFFSCELTLVGNATIKKLNKEHHNKDRVTDVISLSYFKKKMDDPFVGEIFISVPYAKAQARLIGQSLQQELRFLFVHGLLHLFGYDHKKPAEEKRMLKLTYRILGRIK